MFSLDSPKLSTNLLQILYQVIFFKIIFGIYMAYSVLQVDVDILVSLYDSGTICMPKGGCCVF